MIKDSFKPIQKRKKNTSCHPKTVLNRTYDSAKRGLEMANHRDDAAFRVAKSRMLKKLRNREDWNQLAIAEQEKLERETIEMLTAKYESKKKKHLLEWRRKVEAGDIDDDEGEREDEEEDDQNLQASEVMLRNDDEWVDIDEEGRDVDIDDEVTDQQWEVELEALKKIAGVGWQKKMARLEAMALKEVAEWEGINNVTGN